MCKFRHQHPPGTELAVPLSLLATFEKTSHGQSFSTRGLMLYFYENRLRLRIKGTSTRVLFRESARWKTLAALPKKVLCSLPWSIIPHFPQNCSENSHPTEWLKTQLVQKFFCPLSVTFSSVTKVLCLALLLSFLYLHRASVFCHLVLMNIYSQKIVTKHYFNLLQRNVDFKCFRVFAWGIHLTIAFHLWKNAFLGTLNQLLLLSFVLVPGMLLRH